MLAAIKITLPELPDWTVGEWTLYGGIALHCLLATIFHVTWLCRCKKFHKKHAKYDPRFCPTCTTLCFVGRFIFAPAFFVVENVIYYSVKIVASALTMSSVTPWQKSCIVSPDEVTRFGKFSNGKSCGCSKCG